MSRLVAYIGNDPERVQCVLHPGRALLVSAGNTADGWGVGFYQGGEVLLRRRPKPHGGPVDFYEAAAELRTDVLIGHVRHATVGAPKNENTHPFRFRSWLFAHHGTIVQSVTNGGGSGAGHGHTPAQGEAQFAPVRAELLKVIPDFLRRNIRGQTDSEHLFHLFLANLHDAGKLDDPEITPLEAARALCGALALAERLGAQAAGAGAPPAELDVAASNGRILLCSRRGGPVAYYRVRGLRDCAVCREKSAPFEREGRGAKSRAADHEHLKGVVVTADSPSLSARSGRPTGPGEAPWEEIPDRHLIAVNHQLDVQIVPFPAG